MGNFSKICFSKMGLIVDPPVRMILTDETSNLSNSGWRHNQAICDGKQLIISGLKNVQNSCRLHLILSAWNFICYLVFMDSQEQIVIAQIGHDDSMTVSNSRHQTQHHPTRVDHQINEKKFFPRHHKCPEMFIFLLTFPCNLNFKKCYV